MEMMHLFAKCEMGVWTSFGGTIEYLTVVLSLH